MFFEFINRNRKIKELRKDQHYTASELALYLKMETTDILKIDECKLKEIEEPLKSQLLPIFRGDYMDQM